MAPSFFSKLSRSPSPSRSSRPPTISVTAHGSSFDRSSRKSESAVPAGYHSDDSSLQPNVTVVPPSPRSTIQSDVSLPDDDTVQQPKPPTSSPDTSGHKSHRRLKSSPAGSPSLPSPLTDEEGLATPTPATTRTTFQVPPNSPPVPSLSQSRSTGSLRERALLSADGTKYPRSANAVGSNSSSLRQAQDISRSGSMGSRRSAKSGDVPRLDLSNESTYVTALSSMSPNASNDGTMSPIVESPGGMADFIPKHTLIPSSTLPTMPTSSSLLVPDSSDAASVYSVGGTKKKRSWRRLSTSSSQRRAQRKNTGTGLASALAASGLAMASPGVSMPSMQSVPTDQSAYSDILASSQRTRTSLDYPKTPHSARSRQTSLGYATSDVSDHDSFRSVHDSEGSEDEDSDDLDLDPDDIPVTGFAVASNKRNQDFHELFPNIPEGDYLIEDYGCALQREILIQGRLYISENHVCFHANIFGWITDLSIPMEEVTALEKRMTAFVIPNAIQVTTRAAKYTFASFLSRDNTFDVIYNVWRLARRPEDSSMTSLIASPRGSFDGREPEDGSSPSLGAANGGPARKPKAVNKVTQCACGKAGQHYSECAMEVVLPGTPEKIYNLMFTSGFIKDFMRDNQKLQDIQISDWMPMEQNSNSKLLARQMSYIKPLAGGIGPKQTKCELRDETVHVDFDDYAVMLTTTRTPDVPSGGVFSVKTRTCIMWASSVSTKVIVTTEVEWTGRSFIRGIIERSAIDGQKQYHSDLEKAMREYIHEHTSEFIPEGVDVTEVEDIETPSTAESPNPALAEKAGLTHGDARKTREQERSQRGLQWAYDTFEGALKVGRQSAEGAIELITDAWDSSSSTTILYFVIVFLVISNIWTLLLVGSREEVGRHRELRKTAEREKWVQGIVTALWEELLANRNAGTWPPLARSGGEAALTPGEEIMDIHKALDSLEERVRNVRASLRELD